MEKLEAIRHIPLLKGLDEADLRKLAEIATLKKLTIGGKVFAEGDQGDSLFAITYGTVKILKTGQEGAEEVARMGPGQHFGEIALVDNEPRSATVEAIEHTELVQVKRQDLEDLLGRDYALGMRVYRAFARYLCSRLRQTTADLAYMREVAKRRGH